MGNSLAILTLGLGIGAATAMFSFVHPMLLHPLLYPRADRLVVIRRPRFQGRARVIVVGSSRHCQSAGLLRRGSLGIRVLFPDRS